MVSVVAVGLLTSCSEDDSARRPVNPAPSVAVATTTTSTTVAAVGPTTTIAATSSLVVIEPTTSATAATVTTTAATPVSVVDVASELVLLPVGVGTARFGAEADGVIAYISRYIGPPTADSGWIDALESPFGVCSGERVRGLQWGQLQLLFGDESSVSSTPGHFFSYRYGGFTDQPPVPAGLRTDSGLMLGSTLAQIRACPSGGHRLRGPDLRRGVLHQPGWHQRDLDRWLRCRAGEGALRRHRLRRVSVASIGVAAGPSGTTRRLVG